VPCYGGSLFLIPNLFTLLYSCYRTQIRPEVYGSHREFGSQPCSTLNAKGRREAQRRLYQIFNSSSSTCRVTSQTSSTKSRSSIRLGQLNYQLGCQIQERKRRRDVLLLQHPTSECVVSSTLEVNQIHARVHLVKLNIEVHRHGIRLLSRFDRLVRCTSWQGPTVRVGRLRRLTAQSRRARHRD
jgi:hypothetical protein